MGSKHSLRLKFN